MKSRLMLALVLIVVSVTGYAGSASATDSTGFVPSTIAKATFGSLFSHVHSKAPQFWNEVIQTQGDTDLYVQQNTFQPGGSSGWHTHPGPSFVIVTQGSVTVYEGDDASCTPHVYSAGSPNNSFVDIGGGDVHMVRNETGAIAQTVVVQLTPKGATRRIGTPDPGHCGF